MRKNGVIFLIGFGFFVVILLTNDYIQTKKEISKKYNVVITRIEISPTKSMIFYNRNTEIALWSYDIRYYENVKVGDIIYKEENRKYLYILRKDSTTNKFVKILKVDNN